MKIACIRTSWLPVFRNPCTSWNDWFGCQKGFCLPKKKDEKINLQLAMKLKLSRKLTHNWWAQLIIMKSKVVYPSFRLLKRNFDWNNCVNINIKPILAGDNTLLFTGLFGHFQHSKVLFLDNHSEYSSS